MEKHYTKEDLELYRNHQMSVLGRMMCAAHLKECPACAKLLTELQEDDEFVRKLRNTVQLFDELSKIKIKGEKQVTRRTATDRSPVAYN